MSSSGALRALVRVEMRQLQRHAGRSWLVVLLIALPVAAMVAGSALFRITQRTPEETRVDVHLYEPDHCWCRLELVPDAGASTVSLTIASIGGTPVPDVEVVRDLWVAHVNQLGRYQEP